MVIYELGPEEGTKVIRSDTFSDIPPGCVLPQEAAPIEELYDWSRNFNSGRNPYCIFLDLIGYSEEMYGCEAYIAPPFSTGGGRYACILGYKELCLVADALKLFENNGYDQVYAWCRALEDSED